MSNEKIWELLDETANDMAETFLDYASKMRSLVELAEDPEEFEDFKEELGHCEGLFKLVIK